MRPSRTVLRAAVAVAVAALAGCDSTAAPRPVGPTASPAAQNAVLRQYAVSVDTPIRGFQNAWQDYNDRGCLSDASSNVCKRLPLTLEVAAFTMIVAFDAVMTPGAPAYIGPPPAEIAPLVVRTRQAAAKVDADLRGTQVPGWQNDALRLDMVLDGWSMYLAGR